MKSLYRGSRNTIFVIVPRWSLIGSESSIVFVFDIGWNSSGRTQPKIIAHAHLAAAGFDISTRKNVKARVVSQFEFLLPTDAVEKSGFLLIVTVFRLRCTGSCYLKQS